MEIQVEEIIAWLLAPVAYLGFNWVACVLIGVELVLVWRVAAWDVNRHPCSWERPMTRETHTQPANSKPS